MKRRASLHRPLAVLLILLIGVLLLGARGSVSASIVPHTAPVETSDFVCPAAPAALATFCGEVGSVTPVIVELRAAPGSLHGMEQAQSGAPLAYEALTDYALALVEAQDHFLSSLEGRGVRALLREADARQVDGSMRHIEYRFTYLLNGFVAYVATSDLARLRAMPEVAYVTTLEVPTFALDKAIDYSLGTQSSPEARRDAVFGPTHELEPVGAPGHPEAPALTAIDGVEGQGMNIAVIDSGVDYRHPMFGGTGLTTPLPRVAGLPESPDDNRKVIYFYTFSGPVGDPTDDFGHGTLVASAAAGFAVDGNTPPNVGYGTGRDGTGIGPVPNGAQLVGMAPQARIMAYKVCGPAPNCLGDIELSMEDAASPYTLVSTGNPGPTPQEKPVADVINLSLGDTSGDPAGASARAANNAALAGTIVVASAGNSGPGPGTIGSPSAATLAISVAASLDPGSVAGSDVLLPGEVIDPALPATPGPPPETGSNSEANAPDPNEQQGMKIFPVAGGGGLPDGSLSARYVFVDLINNTLPPPEVQNRIALVEFTGAFAVAANTVALFDPAAILLITDVESATAAAVVGDVPTYTISVANGEYLKALGSTNTHGAISDQPLRLSESISLAAFQPAMAGFSSRGPNDHANARFRVIKPDVTAPGVGIYGAATPDGLPDATLGLANPSGYVTANGTSFSGPIAAGAVTLVRQHVRENLGLDAEVTDPDNVPYATRFDAVTISRALLMNASTNLRTGLGVPEGDPAASASINDMGAGHINVSAALELNAIMVAPTLLLEDGTGPGPDEYNPRADQPGGNLEVLIPSASFGAVPVVNLDGSVVRTQEVVVRDITAGSGAGSYTLSLQDNRGLNTPGLTVTFTASAASETPISEISVPAGGQSSFFVRVEADGTQITTENLEIMWYVTATHSGGQALRMPFYLRTAAVPASNLAAPTQGEPQNTEQPPSGGNPYPVDTDGNFLLNWSYSAPAGGPEPIGFRVQEATTITELFFDPADEPLVAGANSQWGGSPQWNSQSNPNTGSLAYYVPDLAEQDEALAMVGSVALPAGSGATLSFDSTQDLEDGFDVGHVEISTNGGGSYQTVLTVVNDFVGQRVVDISPFAGQSIKVRFRLVTDLLNGEGDPAPLGWYVENIRISSDNFQTVADVPGSQTTYGVTDKANGLYFYRIAGRFNSTAGPVIGPYSNTEGVQVNRGATPTPTATSTVLPSQTATATVVPSSTATATMTRTPTATATVAPPSTATATMTRTPTATATVAPPSTATATVAPPSTATATVAPPSTATATVAPSATATRTPTAPPQGYLHYLPAVFNNR